MSSIIQYMTINGVPGDTVLLILMLPIVATIISFTRQILGIKAFGIYTPLIITFAFLATGIKYGIAIFVIVLVIGTLMRFILKRFRLLYLPKMAITFIVIALAMLILFFEGAFSQRTGLIAVSIFPILIIITLTEKFIAAQIKRGNRTAIILTLETLIIAIVCYFVASWPWLQKITLSYPTWVIIVAIILNILLGKWTGLRLTEYLRFKEVIKHVELPKKK